MVCFVRFPSGYLFLNFALHFFCGFDRYFFFGENKKNIALFPLFPGPGLGVKYSSTTFPGRVALGTFNRLLWGV
jgi:hypothetical protein